MAGKTRLEMKPRPEVERARIKISFHCDENSHPAVAPTQNPKHWSHFNRLKLKKSRMGWKILLLVTIQVREIKLKSSTITDMNKE